MAPYWRSQAEAEGLTLLEADNKTGYFGVHLCYRAQVKRGGKDVYLGTFATAEEAALCVARSPEGRAAAAEQAAAERAAPAPRPPASEAGQFTAPTTRSRATLKEEGAVPPMPPGAFVKEEQVAPPMPPDAAVKPEASPVVLGKPPSQSRADLLAAVADPNWEFGLLTSAPSMLAAPAFAALAAFCAANDVPLPTVWPSHRTGQPLPEGCFIVRVRPTTELREPEPD